MDTFEIKEYWAIFLINLIIIYIHICFTMKLIYSLLNNL